MGFVPAHLSEGDIRFVFHAGMGPDLELLRCVHCIWWYHIIRLPILAGFYLVHCLKAVERNTPLLRNG